MYETDISTKKQNKNLKRHYCLSRKAEEKKVFFSTCLAAKPTLLETIFSHILCVCLVFTTLMGRCLDSETVWTRDF